MKKIILVLSLLIFAIYFFKLYQVTVNYAQTDRFVDENDHMMGGYFLLKGKQLYKDISVVHQPLNYYFSAVGQKIFHVNSLFLFINRQREMIWAYALFWNLLYLIFFGQVALLFILIFEVSKFWFLGNLVLGETLTVYPLVFLFGIVIKKLLLKNKLHLYEILMFSVTTFIGVFLLLQLWPTIFLLNLMLLWVHRKEKKLLIWQIIPFLLLTIILFIFVPFKYYIQEVFIYNFRYYIPFMAQIRTFAGYIKMLFIPLTAFHTNPNPMELVTMFFIVLYLGYSYIFLKTKNFLVWLFILFCLVLTNNRDNVIKFTNFHLLPWLGVYFFTPIVLLSFAYKSFSKKYKIIPIFIIIILLTSVLYVNLIAKSAFNTKKNVMTEHDINYHDISKYGLAIKALRQPGDRLIAFPSDNLIHWVSETDLATRQIEYYGWQYNIAEDKNRLIQVFKTHPAEFIVNGEPFNNLPWFIKDYLDAKYIQAKHLGKPSRLYILKTKIPKISEEQWKNFEYLLFQKISS